MAETPELPGMPAAETAGPVSLPATRPEWARVVRPVRGQTEWVARNLEDVVLEDHPARVIWPASEAVNLS